MTATLTALPQAPLVKVKEEPPLGFEDWKQNGKDLFRIYEKTGAALETNQWDLGDWIVKGETQFGKMRAYDEAEQLTSWPRSYLYTVVWVVKRLPVSLRKEATLKWSHFKELARIEDEKVREEALAQVNDGFAHSVLQLRQIVDRKLNRNSAPHGNNGVAYLRVPFAPVVRKLVKKLAAARGQTTDELLGKIVTDYLKENKPKIAADVKKAEEKRHSQLQKRRKGVSAR